MIVEGLVGFSKLDACQPWVKIEPNVKIVYFCVAGHNGIPVLICMQLIYAVQMFEYISYFIESAVYTIVMQEMSICLTLALSYRMLAQPEEKITFINCKDRYMHLNYTNEI